MAGRPHSNRIVARVSRRRRRRRCRCRQAWQERFAARWSDGPAGAAEGRGGLCDRRVCGRWNCVCGRWNCVFGRWGALQPHRHAR